MDDARKRNGQLDRKKQRECGQQQGAQAEAGEEREPRSEEGDRADDEVAHSPRAVILLWGLTPELNRTAKRCRSDESLALKLGCLRDAKDGT